MRYAMMIELDRCIGCQACVSVCKERWDSGPGAARDWVRSFGHGARSEGNVGLTFYPGLCNHCDDHPCTEDCPTQATYANEQGVVVVDPEVCIGCGNCVPKCPYGARRPDERKRIVEKCNFCAPYVARGQQPACVETCLAECRHFGDIADPESELNRLIRERNAKPLVTNEIDVGPRVYYAPPAERLQLLAQGVVKPYGSTIFTELYQRVTAPLARWAVVPVVLLTGLAGLVVNWRSRAIDRAAPAHGARHGAAKGKAGPPGGDTLPRHAAGMRFLHWFNLLSWIVLLVTGTALMSSAGFALFGRGFPDAVARLLGGRPRLIYAHALWGLLWAAIIIPLFLYFKRGGLEALRELLPSYDDVKWLMVKPLVMVGLADKKHLPPQDKYNAGQKLFALSALAGTALIVATGVVMTFHLGSPELVRAAILLHKLAVMLALVGIGVHVTMAAIVAEERPSLWSMLVGQVSRAHAEEHSAKWVAELESGGHGAKPAAEPAAAKEQDSKPDEGERSE